MPICRYEKARQIKQAQDDYCAKATRGDWAGLGAYPENLQWEALVDVLRGRVKVNWSLSHYPVRVHLSSRPLDRYKLIATRPWIWMTSFE